jgi:hypothetical protein
VRCQGQGRRAAEFHTTGLRALPAIICAGNDQLPLELGKATEDREYQPAMGRGRIRPGVGQRAEAAADLGDRIELQGVGMAVGH